MITRYPLFALLAALIFAFSSCGKDETPKVEESPFFSFFDEAAITIDTTPVAADTWEYGFVFNPLVDGQITSLGLKLPVTGNFSVKLWNLDGSTPVILKEQQITSATEHVPVFVDIPAVAVQKEAKLGITILANSFYRLEKQNATDFSYPRVLKNIRIVSFNEETNTSGLAVFPETANSTRVAPCVNVIFIAD